MRESKICHCEIRGNIRKHEKSQAHKNFSEKAIINKYIGKGIYADRLNDIINKRIKEHVEKFTSFTRMFCWKVENEDYGITIVKEEVPDSGLNQESLELFLKWLFNQINIDNFEVFTLMFVCDVKK